MKINGQNLQTTAQFNVGQKKVTGENTVKDQIVLGESKEKPDFLKGPMVNLKSISGDCAAGSSIVGGLGGLILGGISFAVGKEMGIGGVIGTVAVSAMLAGVINGIAGNNEFSLKDFAKGAGAFAVTTAIPGIWGHGGGVAVSTALGATSALMLSYTKE